MNSYTRSKICGLTARGDALAAAEHGADAIGLVFYSGSRRFVAPETAREIAEVVGPFLTLVGLFVDAERREVEKVLETVPLQLLQFHGSETPDYCESFGRPYIKALRVHALAPDADEADLAQSREAILQEARRYSSAQGILLDTLSRKGQGGTGESFNWRCVPQTDEFKWILAGGLEPNNVRKAIQIARPYAVDVSSGVELSAGLKDPERIRLFVSNVKAANEINCGR